MNKNFFKFFALSCLITAQTAQAPASEEERLKKIWTYLSYFETTKNRNNIQHKVIMEGQYPSSKKNPFEKYEKYNFISLRIPGEIVTLKGLKLDNKEDPHNIDNHHISILTPAELEASKSWSAKTQLQNAYKRIECIIKHIGSNNQKTINFNNFGKFSVLSYGVQYSGGGEIHLSIRRAMIHDNNEHLDKIDQKSFFELLWDRRVQKPLFPSSEGLAQKNGWEVSTERDKDGTITTNYKKDNEKYRYRIKKDNSETLTKNIKRTEKWENIKCRKNKNYFNEYVKFEKSKYEDCINFTPMNGDKKNNIIQIVKGKDIQIVKGKDDGNIFCVKNNYIYSLKESNVNYRLCNKVFSLNDAKEMIKNINNYLLSVYYSADFEHLAKKISGLTQNVDSNLSKSEQKNMSNNSNKNIRTKFTTINKTIDSTVVNPNYENDNHREDLLNYSKTCCNALLNINDKINNWKKALHDIGVLAQTTLEKDKNLMELMNYYEQYKILQENSNRETLSSSLMSIIKDFQDTITEIQGIKFENTEYLSLETYREIFKTHLTILKKMQKQNEGFSQKIELKIKDLRQEIISIEGEKIKKNIINISSKMLLGDKVIIIQDPEKNLNEEGSEKMIKEMKEVKEKMIIEKIRKTLSDVLTVYFKNSDTDDISEVKKDIILDLFGNIICISKKDIEKKSKIKKKIQALQIEQIKPEFLSNIYRECEGHGGIIEKIKKSLGDSKQNLFDIPESPKNQHKIGKNTNIVNPLSHQTKKEKNQYTSKNIKKNNNNHNKISLRQKKTPIHKGYKM